MDLILIRHAIAHERDAARWPDDRERPLTRRGVKRFRRAARGIRLLAPEVEALLTSPFRRAQETAALLVDEAQWPEPTLEPLLAGGAPAEALAVSMGSRIDASPLALVGHEPQLGQLVAILTGAGPHVGLVWRKGGVVRLHCVEPALGDWQLAAVLPPKVLRSLAG